jgi:hypothetical protein
VKVSGSDEPLPYPGCSGHVESAAGIDYSRDGKSLAQTLTVHTMGYPGDQVTTSVRVHGDATSDEVTSTAYVSEQEYGHNPDAAMTYGTSSKKSCVRDALGTDASYPGRLDTALPAIAAGADDWYVADRDGNTIYRLDQSGELSVLAVLAPVRVEVSKALAKSNGWPSCVVGTTVAFEAAPTEVEVAPDGSVYVAGLPRLASGKQADRSVIYKINPKSGKTKRLSQRYAGSVDLAVGTGGRLFVARPEADKISVIKKGRSSTYVKLAEVESVETDERGRLYAVQGARTGADAHDADVVRIS